MVSDMKKDLKSSKLQPKATKKELEKLTPKLGQIRLNSLSKSSDSDENLFNDTPNDSKTKKYFKVKVQLQKNRGRSKSRKKMKKLSAKSSNIYKSSPKNRRRVPSTDKKKVRLSKKGTVSSKKSNKKSPPPQILTNYLGVSELTSPAEKDLAEENNKIQTKATAKHIAVINETRSDVKEESSESSFNFRLNSQPETPKIPQEVYDSLRSDNPSVSESTHRDVLGIMQKIQDASAMYSEISNLVVNLEEASRVILQVENSNSELRKSNEILKRKLRNTESMKNRIESELRIWKQRGERILRIDEKLEEKFQILQIEIQKCKKSERSKSKTPKGEIKIDLQIGQSSEIQKYLIEEIDKVNKIHLTEIKKRDTLVEDLWMEVKKYRKKEKDLILKLEVSEQVQGQLKDQMTNFVRETSPVISTMSKRGRSRSHNLQSKEGVQKVLQAKKLSQDSPIKLVNYFNGMGR